MRTTGWKVEKGVLPTAEKREALGQKNKRHPLQQPPE